MYPLDTQTDRVTLTEQQVWALHYMRLAAPVMACLLLSVLVHLTKTNRLL